MQSCSFGLEIAATVAVAVVALAVGGAACKSLPAAQSLAVMSSRRRLLIADASFLAAALTTTTKDPAASQPADAQFQRKLAAAASRVYSVQ